VHLATALLAIGGLAACGDGEPAPGPTAGVDEATTSGEGIGVDRPVVTAVGVGRASGPPDVLVVSLNVHTEGASAAEAMDTTSLVVTQLQATVREQGVARSR